MKPGLIRNDDVPWEDIPANGSAVRLKPLVSPEPRGSTLGMYLTELPPGHTTVWWSFLADDDSAPSRICLGDRRHEAYFVLAGRLRMTTRDVKGHEEAAEAGPGDSFYLAPGYRYRVSNVGNQPAVFLFSTATAAS